MILGEYFRVDYTRNRSEGKGPLPPGLGRGFDFEPELFWPLPEFLTDSGLSFLKSKASLLLAGSGIRKDFAMPQSGGTPRNMRVVPGTVINNDPELMSLYRNDNLREFLGRITGSRIIPYPDPLENVVITSLEGPDDTHGEHLDVPPIALVMCLEAPPSDQPGKRIDVKDSGGEVWQSILGTDDSGGLLAFVNVYGDQQLHPMVAGDAYLIRSDILPHQVLPMSRNGTPRTILNFTYGIEGLQCVQDGSAQALFV